MEALAQSVLTVLVILAHALLVSRVSSVMYLQVCACHHHAKTTAHVRIWLPTRPVNMMTILVLDDAEGLLEACHVSVTAIVHASFLAVAKIFLHSVV
jgi:hypothetical protein